MLKILMLAEKDTANTNNWVNALRMVNQVRVEVWSLPRWSPAARLAYIPFAILAVRLLIRRIVPDIVIGYRTTSYGFIAAMSGFRTIVIAAQGESDVWPPGHWSNHISAFMAKLAIRRASLIHAWGRHMVPSLLRHGAREEQIMVMPRGIDIDNFRFNVPFDNQGKCTIIVSRSLYPEYHHDIILQGFAAAKRRLVDVECRLIIVGSGPLYTHLQEKVQQLDIEDSVLFTGRISADRLGPYLSESDIYLSLPETEGVSSSLLEAMASGCYPIVSNVAANRAIIVSGENGRLVALSADEVATAIVDTFRTCEMVQDQSRSNRVLVESYANSRVNCQKFVARYMELIFR